MDTIHRTTETNHDTYLSLSEATARRYAGYSTLRKYIAEGRLPASRVGHRIRLRQSDLDALLTPVGTDPIDLTVERLVAAAPELTPEQVTRLRAALGGAR